MPLLLKKYNLNIKELLNIVAEKENEIESLKVQLIDVIEGIVPTPSVSNQTNMEISQVKEDNAPLKNVNVVAMRIVRIFFHL